jgi:hypothetical protein
LLSFSSSDAGFSHATFFLEKTIMQVKLPPKFQPHPECAAGILTLDQAAMMIRMGWLTHEGAQFVLPPRAWPLLPQPEQEQAVTQSLPVITFSAPDQIPELKIKTISASSVKSHRV